MFPLVLQRPQEAMGLLVRKRKVKAVSRITVVVAKARARTVSEKESLAESPVSAWWLVAPKVAAANYRD
jgi:hypothetical protein